MFLFGSEQEELQFFRNQLEKEGRRDYACAEMKSIM